MLIKSEKEMLRVGKEFGLKLLQQKSFPVVIELLGDVGAGKTTFTRGLAKGLGVQEELSSPSFTISRSYSGEGCILTHFDFYRISDPGLMSEDLAEAITIPSSVTVIEWGQDVHDLLPESYYKVEISYLDETSRELNLEEVKAWRCI